MVFVKKFCKKIISSSELDFVGKIAMIFLPDLVSFPLLFLIDIVPKKSNSLVVIIFLRNFLAKNQMRPKFLGEYVKILKYIYAALCN